VKEMIGCFFRCWWA